MSQLSFLKKPSTIWIGALVLCLLWNYAHFMRPSDERDQPYIMGWDSNLYFAWARSLALDGDIDFRNDYNFVANWKGGGATQDDFAWMMENGPRTPTGRLPNITGFGLGLAAVPAVYAARGPSALWTALTGIRVSPFAAVYCVAFLFTSVLIGFAGLAVTFRILRERFGEPAAFRAMIAGMLGLPTIYYLWFDVAMSQAPVFGFSAIMVAMMLRWHAAIEAPDPRPRAVLGWAFGMGVMYGVVTMTHFPAMAWGAAPAALGVRLAWDRLKGRDQKRDDAQRSGGAAWAGLLGGSVALTAFGAFLGFLPQFIVWKILYGTWIMNTYEVSVHFRLIDVWNVFFDSRIGLFLWTPLAVAAVGGLMAGAWRREMLCVAGCAVFLVFLWEFSSCSLFIGGAQGHAFGMRYFVDGAFVFFLGLAVFMRWIGAMDKRSLARRAGMAAVALLVAWNLYFIVAFRADIQPHGEPIAIKAVLTNFKDWHRRAKKEINIPKQLRKIEFPLFTPIDTLPAGISKNTNQTGRGRSSA